MDQHLMILTVFAAVGALCAVAIGKTGNVPLTLAVIFVVGSVTILNMPGSLPSVPSSDTSRSHKEAMAASFSAADIAIACGDEALLAEAQDRMDEVASVLRIKPHDLSKRQRGARFNAMIRRDCSSATAQSRQQLRSLE